MTDELTTQATAQELIALYRAAESRAARMRLLLGAGRDLAVAAMIDDAAVVVLQRSTEFSAFPEGCLVLADAGGRYARVRARLGDRYPPVGYGYELCDRENGCEYGLVAAVRERCVSVGSFAPCVALRFGSEGGAIGALLLGADGVAPRLDTEDRETLSLLLANFAAIVLIARQRDEQSRLHSLLAEREARLDDLVGRLISAQEDERRRLSIELHDGLAQITSSAHQHLQAFSETCGVQDPAAAALLENGLRLIRRATAETRAMMADLRPTLLDDFGIGKAIEHEADEFRRQHGNLTLDNSLESVRLGPDVETALFRVAQEALRNVRKHAPDARVFMALMIDHDAVLLCICDDGGGFSMSADGDPGGRGERLGLMGMHERMKRVGGSCRIDSVPGCGVRVEARVPLPERPRGRTHATGY